MQAKNLDLAHTLTSTLGLKGEILIVCLELSMLTLKQGLATYFIVLISWWCPSWTYCLEKGNL